MFDPKTPLAILGLALSISGTIAGGYVLVERFFSCRLFSIFLTLTPRFLQSFFPHEPAIAWFEIRSNRNLYETWDVSLIYLLLTSLIFTLLLGFWAFLILRILKVFNLGTFWLIFWFVALCFNYMWSAVNQHAVEIKAQHKRATVEGIKRYMMQDPITTSKRWIYNFFRNWIKAPFTALELLSIVVLFLLLHWPAWLLKGVGILKMDLNDINARKYYYTAYAVIFLIVGLLLQHYN